MKGPRAVFVVSQAGFEVSQTANLESVPSELDHVNQGDAPRLCWAFSKLGAIRRSCATKSIGDFYAWPQTMSRPELQRRRVEWLRR